MDINKYKVMSELSKMVHTAEMCASELDYMEIMAKIRTVETTMFQMIDEFYYSTGSAKEVTHPGYCVWP